MIQTTYQKKCLIWSLLPISEDQSMTIMLQKQQQTERQGTGAVPESIHLIDSQKAENGVSMNCVGC